MADNVPWYLPWLMPWEWRGRPDDHPWFVQTQRDLDRLRAAKDERGQLVVVWNLGALVANAELQALGGSDDGVKHGLEYVTRARALLEERTDDEARLRDKRLAELETHMRWTARLARADDWRPLLRASPYAHMGPTLWLLCRGVDLAARNVFNHLVPEGTRPPRETPRDWWARIREHWMDRLDEADVHAFMGSLVDLCGSIVDGPWEELRRIDYAGDLATNQDIVKRVVADAPPRQPLKALWFGFFNPIYEGLTTADTYFRGSWRFDPSNEEWIYETDYEPEGGYVHSSAVGAIYDAAHRWTDLGDAAEGPVVEAYGAYLARRAGEAYASGEGRPVWITLGWDSGEPVDLGWVGPGVDRAPRRVLPAVVVPEGPWLFLVPPGRVEGRPAALAYLEKDGPGDPPALEAITGPFHSVERVDDWKELEYRLGSDRDPFADLQLTVGMDGLFSVRLCELIVEHLDSADDVQWLPVWVARSSGEDRRRYFLAHLPDPPEILDLARSVFLGEGEAAELTVAVYDPDRYGHGRSIHPPQREAFGDLTGRPGAALIVRRQIAEACLSADLSLDFAAVRDEPPVPPPGYLGPPVGWRPKYSSGLPSPEEIDRRYQGIPPPPGMFR